MDDTYESYWQKKYKIWTGLVQRKVSARQMSALLSVKH